ncbi:hypothetical protein RCL1_007824 [Eukaryota sp. TZLM3-RCL]
MPKIALMVVGPAGSGKSTFCSQMLEHFTTIRRVVHVVNLDPAADYLPYKPSFDIRDLISLNDAMEEMELGPNGGLVFCMEYLLQNLDWLEEQLGEYDDDYLLLDCPGQIELYTNVPSMRFLTGTFQNWGYNLVGMYCLDVTFVLDPPKLISGLFTCLSTMYQFGLPHINLLTKCDMMEDTTDLEEKVSPARPELEYELNIMTSGKYQRLNKKVVDFLRDNDVVSVHCLNYADEDSLGDLLVQLDMVTQYYDDAEVKEAVEVEE